jgi:hypothetical protein
MRQVLGTVDGELGGDFSFLTIPKDTAYRMREFARIDPDGNLLRIGYPLSKAGE